MEALDIIDITRDAIWVLIKVSLPLMIVALVIGVGIGLLQALTQIQETTLTFVPKILAILVCIMLMMPFFIQQLQDMNERMYARIAKVE